MEHQEQRKFKAGRKQRRLRSRLAAYNASREVRGKAPMPQSAVPSFFTIMNLFCGFLAITQILENRFEQACWLIVLAGFFDAMDGMMARLTNSQSRFGVELDSLSDIVSFGVAPSFLIYVFALKGFGMLGLIAASLPTICGAVRLARYNVDFDGVKQDYFEGLPIPVMAATVVALVLNFNNAEWFSQYSPNNITLLVPIVVVLSGLMVSTIEFDALPKPTPAFLRANRNKAIAYLVAVVLLVTLQQIGLLVCLVAYLLHGIVRAVYSLLHNISDPPDHNGSTEIS
ncbi:MAG: CDP-diacylglycerol--serine O-phosphatidyltransferase [Rhodothermales bacterium]|nr:CDP-diacylglycerol--serine O-phosphatidyltransferase [Rhodothermales bacterium]